ncbi:MAG: hypothetical protein FWE03_06340 [Firmicutes bacterium]|nr:hypothetical protein [Bacillota bacterium]
MKKKLIVMLISIVVFVLIIPANLAFRHAYAEIIDLEDGVLQFHENANRSIEIAQDVLSQFRNKVINDNSLNNSAMDNCEAIIEQDTVEYNDDFAGIFIDEYGMLNVGIVTNDRQVRQLNSNYDGQVVYRNKQYSLNHLKNIKNFVWDIGNNYSIQKILIDEKLNHVTIELINENDIDLIIDYLIDKGLYSSTALNFEVDAERRIVPTSRTIYGGSNISTAGLNMMTTTANARCNETRQLGILTTAHGVRSRVLYRGSIGAVGTRIGRASNYFLSPLRNLTNTVDAAFVPFEHQGNWTATANAINDYTNIRRGGEHLIIQGAPVRRFGRATGDTAGVIRSRFTGASFEEGGQDYFIHNAFSFSNGGRGGDSGGPVYFDGGGGRLFLIGMNFASNTGNSGHGYASRITLVESLLNVTVIASDSNMMELRAGTYTIQPQTSLSMNHELHLRGNNNILDIQINFTNGTTRTISITGNGTQTVFRTNASEWQQFNRTIWASFVHIRFTGMAFEIRASDTGHNLVWHQFFSVWQGNIFAPHLPIRSLHITVNQSNLSNLIFGRVDSFIRH